MTGRTRAALVIGLLTCAVATAACISDRAPTAPLRGDCRLQLAPSVAGSTIVPILDFTFQTADLQIAKGTTVTWVNCDTEAHTATSNDGEWDSSVLTEGNTFSFAFNTPGVFGYHCTLHPFMTGRITVAP